jgi:hypothetical protein
MLVFAYFTVVQYNDPDPWLWIPTYLFPIYLIYQKLQGRLNGSALFLIGIPYLFWAINQFPPEWEGVMLKTMGMKTINIELGRESLGLGFTALVLFLISFSKK